MLNTYKVERVVIKLDESILHIKEVWFGRNQIIVASSLYQYAFGDEFKRLISDMLQIIRIGDGKICQVISFYNNISKSNMQMMEFIQRIYTTKAYKEGTKNKRRLVGENIMKSSPQNFGKSKQHVNLM
ncbi:hypothetical protein RIR_jg24848.t1 [Rhizophagus irregularis DAOM 181602=DAOM 197198]|nr:hypothetical protein RIR_jg24848.t1 [Rhizophagus irregularis DAOM 181602=DAOM 197198]